jgi:hypothetical protein
LRKKIIMLEKIHFITNKNKSKTVLVSTKIMELSVRIAIPQLVDNKQIYEEIPPVLVLSSFIPHPIKMKISIRCVSVK